MFSGIYAVLPTPFQWDETIDFEALRINIDYLNNSQIDGVLALGSTGELFLSLSESEKQKFMELIKEFLHQKKTNDGHKSRIYD